jgi:selenide, water dikinase
MDNMIDIEKRRRVMDRSLKLCHCICDPKKPCPCDLFRERDLCLCAGERPEDAPEDVPLTSLVKNAGCASKINQNDLKRVLVGLPPIDDPRVLVGSNTADDAGVFKLDDETALVQTVDVFTPGVDDPYVFGQIAAANSLSDVYAMGGRPLSALAIIGFPIETLSPRLMTRILRGGLDKMHEAGVPIVGGHSINDLDVKYGFAVTGIIHPDRIVTNANARPGDMLVLTKPLGVGIVSFAAQLGEASAAAMADIAASMTTLNKAAAEAMIDCSVTCATDITGFGLMGHLSEMVRQSEVTAEIWATRVPVFDEVLDYVRRGLISGAIERNREYASQYVAVSPEVDETLAHVLYDPQTSGGLLMAVPPDRVGELLERVESAVVVGRIVEPSEGRIMVISDDDRSEKAAAPCCAAASHAQEMGTDPANEPAPCCAAAAHSPEAGTDPVTVPGPCCAGSAASTAGTAKEKFGAFMTEVNSGGTLSPREKELMALVLSIISKCEPCVKIHLKKAAEAGLTEAESEEAVWMAISFGGAPTMMWYNSLRGK